MSEKHSAASTVLTAVAYGDAFGLPAEGKSADEIAAQYGTITELVSPAGHPFFPYEGRGATSDDTQLSVAVAEGLIAANGFSVALQVEKHTVAYLETPAIRDTDGILLARGWGKSTIRAMERLMEGVSPEHSGEKQGGGSGVVMKMAPLAIWQAFQGLDTTARYEQYDTLTTMTHDSDIARFCTRLHGDVIALLLNGDGYLDDVVHDAVQTLPEDTFAHEIHLLKRATTDPCDTFEALVARYAEGKSGKKYGFYVPETLAMTYDILLSSSGDFETAVRWAANLGGDADSTASIVASLIACSTDGAFQKPGDFTKVQAYDQLTRTSMAFEKLVETSFE